MQLTLSSIDRQKSFTQVAQALLAHAMERSLARFKSPAKIWLLEVVVHDQKTQRLTDSVDSLNHSPQAFREVPGLKTFH